MKINSVFYSSSFKKSIKRYLPIRTKIEKTIAKFINNPLDPSLKTHKLTGKLSSYWSFSIDFHLRILFEFIDDETVGFIDVGTHEIYI